MTNHFSEDEVHEYMYETGLEDLVLDCPVIDNSNWQKRRYHEEFQLWELLKQKALLKLLALTIPFGMATSLLAN